MGEGRTKKILEVMEGGDDDLASGEGEKQELVGPPSQVHHCAMSDGGREND